MDGAFELNGPTDQRVDVPVFGALHQVGGKRLEGVPHRTGLVLVLSGAAISVWRRLLLFSRDLRDPVGDIVQNVQPGNTLLAQQVERVAVLLAEHGDEEVAPFDHFLATGLYVGGGALQDALEPQGLLRLSFDPCRQLFQVLLEELLQVALQRFDVPAALADDIGHGLVKEQRVQHMLQAQKLVAAASGLFDRQREGNLKLSANSHPSLPKDVKRKA